MPAPKLISIGQRFGRYVVKNLAENRNKLRYVDVVCDCGSERAVSNIALWSGRSKSCGCLKRELMANQSRTHGQSKSGAYKSWVAMQGRCRNKNNAKYPTYGGVGIVVCEAWSRFEAFLSDMGDRPENMTIDRIDGSLGYSPGNCKWSTKSEQQNNLKTNSMHSCDGVSKTIAQWSEYSGIPYNRLYGRLRMGWTMDRAIKVP